MDWRVWIAFVTASAAMGLVPGPGVMSIVGYALTSGRRVALASVAGMATGNAVAMTLSLVGVGALLAASATAFALVKGTGAVYLIVLGALALARAGTGSGVRADRRPPTRAWAAFASNLVVGTFHPKTIVFFVAFAPQFISPGRGYAGQAALLVATFCLTVAATDAGYALAAARAARLFRTPGARLWSRRAGGTALVASGLATAASRR